MVKIDHTFHIDPICIGVVGYPLASKNENFSLINLKINDEF